MKIGIIGCGSICRTYLAEIRRLYPHLIEVEALADLDLSRAKAYAREFSVPVAASVEELLALPQIELVINLTVPLAHVEVSRKILESGKHLFSEKPFALSAADALSLAELAKEKGLVFGCAPDTFLMAPLAQCRTLIDEGKIGTPLFVSANMVSSGVESWHPAPQPFYRRGGGPLYDMGPYYLTALVFLFGAVEEVYAVGKKGFETRIFHQSPGKEAFPVEVPTHYSAVLKMKSGVVVSLMMSFDIFHSNLPKMEVYGSEGTLIVPDPNMTSGEPAIFRKEQITERDFAEKPVALEKKVLSEYTRGSGVAELVLAIRAGRKSRMSDLPIHVTDVIESLIRSAETDAPQKIATSCERPEIWDFETEALKP